MWVPNDSAPPDTLATVVGRELSREGWELPFSLHPDWATDGRKVYYGKGRLPEIAVLRADGTVERLIRWRAGRAIGEADWSQYQRDFDAIVAFDPRMAPRRVTPALLPYDSVPVFAKDYLGGAEDAYLRAVLVDDQGHLWVRKYSYVPVVQRVPSERTRFGEQQWWVFDPRGVWLGDVVTPRDLVVKTISEDFVIGVSEDELGSEQIHAYRLRRPEDQDAQSFPSGPGDP